MCSSAAANGQARPTVILIPAVMGVSGLEIGLRQATRRARLQCAGRRRFSGKSFAAILAMWMVRRAGAPQGGPLSAPPPAAVDSRGRREASTKSRRGNIVVAGYCFGGLCALDVARSGADISAAVAFHALFDPPGLPPQKIKAKVAAFHGWDDPMVPPEMVVALGQETDRGAAPTGRFMPMAMSATASPTPRRMKSASTALPTTRSPPNGRGPVSSTCSRNCFSSDG